MSNTFRLRPDQLTAETIARFWAKVQICATDECWPWLASLRGGYGQVKIDGGGYKAHRVAFAITNGCPPDGLMVCHRCDNPPCCNPDHLYLGTAADNQSDAVTKKRQNMARKTHCPAGHPYAGANLRMEAGGGRRCRQCALDNNRAYERRRRRRVA